MNILIIFSNRLGDVIMSLPFVQGVKAVYPESKIYTVIGEELIEFMELVPLIRGSYPKIKSRYMSFLGNIQTANNIRKDRKFDLCICLSDAFSAATIAYFSRIKIRIGHKKEGRSFLLTHSYKYSIKREHMVNYSFHLLESYLEKETERNPYTIELEKRNHNILPEGKNLIFNINTLGKSKILPNWRAIEMLNGIQKKYKFNIILIGTQNEKDSNDQLINQIQNKENAYNYAGKTSLVELTYLLHKADVMISTDTGSAHLANAVGTKLIVFFGSGDHRKSRPYNPENLVIINKNLPCSPCLLKDCKFEEPICLTQIENSERFVALDKLIAKA